MDSIQKGALLIGVNHYDEFEDLCYAREDVESMAAILKRYYGFSDSEIIIMTDTSSRKPDDRFSIQEQITKSVILRNLDLFIFVFCGHGIIDDSVNDSAGDSVRYLCPKNARMEFLAETGLSLKKLESWIAQLQPANACLILDCCQSKTTKSGSRGCDNIMAAGEESTLRNMAETIQKEVQQIRARDIAINPDAKQVETEVPESVVAILNACSEGQRAYEWPERRHGIFSAHLLNGLKRRIDHVTELFDYVCPRVVSTSGNLLGGKNQKPFFVIKGGTNISLPVNDSMEPRYRTQSLRLEATFNDGATRSYCLFGQQELSIGRMNADVNYRFSESLPQPGEDISTLGQYISRFISRNHVHLTANPNTMTLRDLSAWGTELRVGNETNALKPAADLEWSWFTEKDIAIILSKVGTLRLIGRPMLIQKQLEKILQECNLFTASKSDSDLWNIGRRNALGCIRIARQNALGLRSRKEEILSTEMNDEERKTLTHRYEKYGDKPSWKNDPFASTVEYFMVLNGVSIGSNKVDSGIYLGNHPEIENNHCVICCNNQSFSLVSLSKTGIPILFNDGTRDTLFNKEAESLVPGMEFRIGPVRFEVNICSDNQ